MRFKRFESCGNFIKYYFFMKLPNVPPTASSPFKFLILFRARHNIFKCLSPFKFAIFSILLVDRDSLVHADKFVKLNQTELDSSTNKGSFF